MGATELYKEGRLREAIDAAVQDVKQAPGNVHLRIFLFELLAAAGELERAKKHLDVVVEQAPGMLEGATSYLGVVAAAQRRASLLAKGGGQLDQVLPGPPQELPQLAALRALVAGDSATGSRLLDEAEEARPSRRGTIDGAPFEDLRDADDFFSGILEVIAQGRYGWIPFEKITRVEIPEPKHFRDLLWLPASIEVQGGISAKMFLPTRYPGSELHRDDAIKLGRSTEWSDEDGLTRGYGQRALLGGDELRYLLDVREIVFEG